MTFDCFGTLVDWHGGFSNILHKLADDRTPELLLAYHEFERVIEAERPHRLYRDVLVEAIVRAAWKLGIHVSEAQARALPGSWGTLPVFPDVESMLAELRTKGYRLGMLTNCDEDLFAKTHQNFRVPFDLVITAERVRDYKPSLSHFRFFSRTTGVDHDQWVHVACSWFHDIVPARELGIKRVWLDRDGTGEDPTAASARVKTGLEVCESLARLEAAG